MLNSKLLAPLIAVAAVMLVASVALAAVVFSGDGDGDDDDGGARNAAMIATATPVTPSLSTTTPGSTATAGNVIPDALRQRFEAMPEKLRNEALDQMDKGLLHVQQLEQVIRAFEQRNSSVRVGSVIEADSDSVRLEVYTTGEDVTVGLNADTVITRAHQPIKASDLRKDEMVMVISRDNGATAFGIEALGVGRP